MKKVYKYIFCIGYIILFFASSKTVSAATDVCPASALEGELKDGTYSLHTISANFYHSGGILVQFVPKQLYIKLAGGNSSYGKNRTGINIRIEQSENKTDDVDRALAENDGEFVEIDFYLQDDFQLTYNGKKCTYKKDTIVYRMDVFPTYQSDNPMYDDALCVSLRQDYPKQSNCNSTNSLSCYAYQIVPECYEKKANNIVADDISSIGDRVSNFRAYANKVETAKNNVSGDDPEENSYQCNYYTDEKETIVKERTQETTSIEGCYKTCHEKVTVTFDPPILTESGMCFTYVSEIKSTVDCKTEFLRPEPKEKSIVCYDIPTCKHTDGVGDSAGPNDDFDRCVVQCDHGKYTQECVDACYQKVYEDDDTALSNYLTYDDKEIKKLAEGPNSNWTASNCNNLFSDRSLMGLEEPKLEITGDDSNYALIEELVKFKSMYPGGKVKNGQWVASTQAKECPSNVSPYYFRTVQSTLHWINRLRNSYTMKNGIIGTANKKGEVENKKFACSSKCSFESCGSNSLSSANFDPFAAEENRAQWEADRAKCLEGNLCKDYVRNGEFTIEVDQNTVDGKLTSKYNATHKQDSDQVTNSSVYDEREGSSDKNNLLNLDNNSIVRDFSGVCMNGKTVDGQVCESDVTTDDLSNNQTVGNENSGCYAYRDLLSFPRNYINNKTGQTTHAPNSSLGVTDIGEQYCTKLTTLATNVDWYDWKVYGDGSLPTGEVKNAIEKNTKRNIRVRIENFGYFGWNFDIDCFYALIRDPLCEEMGTCTCEELGTCPDDLVPPKTPTETKESAKNLDINPVTNNLVFRTIDLNKVFTRDARYNWNCNSTNLENQEYIVQPTALITNIEKKGDSIYSDANELDYKFHLDAQDIAKIKEYNNENKNFFQTKGNSTVEQDGISVYKSPFLDEFSSIMQKRGVIGCNNASGNQCTESNKAITRDACYQEYMADKGSE